MPPWSRLPAFGRIGPDYFARSGALRDDVPPPRGLVDRTADLAHPSIEAARVHPDVRVFLEDTARLELFIESEWVPWAARVWRLIRPWFAKVGQLALPLRESMVRTRMISLDPVREGRPGVRGVIRTHSDGSVMQVVAYAVHSRGGTGLMSVVFPTPLGVLTGLLRLDAIADEDGALAVALTSSRAGGDDAGVYLRVFGLQCPTPLGERMAMWSASMRCRPAELDPAKHKGTTLVGEHVQRLFGVKMVTHRYWFVPLDGS